MHRLILAAALFGLAACGQSRGYTERPSGEALAEQARQNAQPSASHVSFAGTDDVVRARKFTSYGTLDSERLTLSNGSTLYYHVLKAAPPASTDEDKLRVYLAAPFYTQKGVTYAAGKVKRWNSYTYAIASSEAYHCLIYVATFGAAGARDREVGGSLCYFVTSITVDQLEREMLDVMGRIRVDGAPVPAQAAAADRRG